MGAQVPDWNLPLVISERSEIVYGKVKDGVKAVHQRELRLLSQDIVDNHDIHGFILYDLRLTTYE